MCCIQAALGPMPQNKGMQGDVELLCMQGAIRVISACCCSLANMWAHLSTGLQVEALLIAHNEVQGFQEKESQIPLVCEIFCFLGEVAVSTRLQLGLLCSLRTLQS